MELNLHSPIGIHEVHMAKFNFSLIKQKFVVSDRHTILQKAGKKVKDS